MECNVKIVHNCTPKALTPKFFFGSTSLILSDSLEFFEQEEDMGWFNATSAEDIFLSGAFNFFFKTGLTIPFRQPPPGSMCRRRGLDLDPALPPPCSSLSQVNRVRAPLPWLVRHGSQTTEPPPPRTAWGVGNGDICSRVGLVDAEHLGDAGTKCPP